MTHRTLGDLEARLDHIRLSPATVGTVELIVRRPGVDLREVVESAYLDVTEGLVGDTWRARYPGEPNRDAQVALMNARVVAAVAGDHSRWPLAGDQFYVDLDLNVRNLPPKTRLRLGSAVVEVTAKPHRGCAKFAERFGADALRFVNLDSGPELRLRGVYVRVVEPGTVRLDDVVSKL